MQKFMHTFFGSPEPLTLEAQLQFEIQISDQDLRHYYHLGYKQINSAIKNKMRQFTKLIDMNNRPLLHPDRPADEHLDLPEKASEKDPVKGNFSLFLPHGSDSGLINVDPRDNGSIVSYCLCSNVYKEALIKNNYLDFQSKLKQLMQQQNDSHQIHGSKQPINLFHKNDIFNYEIQQQAIESELRAGE